MTIKSILLSNGNGTILESPTGSFGYDDNTDYIYISTLSASQINISGASNSVFISDNGQISALPAAGNSGKFIVSDGNRLVVDSAQNIANGNTSGDLSGSYPSPIVKSLSNAVSGTLPVSLGGLGNTLSDIPSGSLILASGTGSLVAVSTANATSSTEEYVLGSNNGAWAAINASAVQRDVSVQFFTCSAANTTSTYTWTKSNPNHIWARVMIQAGGGAGAGSGTVLNAANGGGGGGGGFSDFTMFVSGVNSATVVVGAGGTSTSTANTNAQAGSDTTFSGPSGLYLRAAGGGGGTTTAGGAGGIGFNFYGSSGGDAGVGLDSAGASGGGAGSNIADGFAGGIASKFLNPVIAPVNSSGSYKENIFQFIVPFGFGTGGSGGGQNMSGYPGAFGGGGGGAGAGTSPFPGRFGGNGGDGFAIIVSY
jgi:hypothetical protein